MMGDVVLNELVVVGLGFMLQVRRRPHVIFFFFLTTCFLRFASLAFLCVYMCFFFFFNF